MYNNPFFLDTNLDKNLQSICMQTQSIFYLERSFTYTKNKRNKRRKLFFSLNIFNKRIINV